MNHISRRQLSRYAVERLLADHKISELSKELAAVLVGSNRNKEVDMLVEDIVRELEVRRQLVNAVVITVHPLTPLLRKQLNDALRKATAARHIELDERVDKSILGGLQVKTATRRWDSTARRKLTDLRKRF